MDGINQTQGLLSGFRSKGVNRPGVSQTSGDTSADPPVQRDTYRQQNQGDWAPPSRAQMLAATGKSFVPIASPRLRKALAETAHRNPITGEKTPTTGTADWAGERRLPRNTPLVIMAGHADAQRMQGSGAPGQAVRLGGEKPMEPKITDELFWNRRIAQATVTEGQKRGLNITYRKPPSDHILNENDPQTDWSTGERLANQGAYTMEIHCDADGPEGSGSGVIPQRKRQPTRIEGALGERFGRYPMDWRGGLGAPTRGTALLEVGKLEGELEAKLRNPLTSRDTIQRIAQNIVDGIEEGLEP